jgi:hypothetical protein
VFDNIKAVKDGKFKGGNFVGPVALAPFHDFRQRCVKEIIKAKLEEVNKGLMDGSIKTNVAHQTKLINLFFCY